jgi:hypothetical protein
VSGKPSWTVRTLTTADSPALSSILTSVAPMGPRIDRGPDPFAHPRSSGEALHIGAFHDERLVAVVGGVAQRRHVGGAPRRTVYVFDARVASDFRGTLVLALVLKALRAAFAADAWCHAVVFEDSPYVDRLGRGLRWFGASRLLGRTRHVAYPAFLDAGGWARGVRVEETEPDAAASAYFRLARRRDLSPADEVRFRGGGRFFVRRRGREVVAVGKLVDESATRRVLADDRSVRGASVLNLLARIRRFPSLPAPGAPVAISYLSSYASDDGVPPVAFALAAAAVARTCTHVCFGVDAAAPPPAHPLAHHFVSRTYAYGDVPSSLQMQSHELTWM